jgi:hypothetical protein
MVLGTTERTSECQYSVKVELWHSEESRVSECHKTPLRELWSSETRENSIRLVLVKLAPCVPKFSRVQSANNSTGQQSAKTPSMYLRAGEVISLQQNNRTAGGQHRVKKCRFKRGINP